MWTRSTVIVDVWCFSWLFARKPPGYTQSIGRTEGFLNFLGVFPNRIRDSVGHCHATAESEYRRAGDLTSGGTTYIKSDLVNVMRRRMLDRTRMPVMKAMKEWAEREVSCYSECAF